MNTPTYNDRILEARDVCANCHRRVRVERVDPVRGGSGELDSHYSRHEQTTTVEFGPADNPPDSKGVFCECGVEDHRVQDRLWSDPVDRDRFRELLKATLGVLDSKGVTFDSHRAAAVALSLFDDGHPVDQSLGRGVESGVIAATVQS